MHRYSLGRPQRVPAITLVVRDDVLNSRTGCPLISCQPARVTREAMQQRCGDVLRCVLDRVFSVQIGGYIDQLGRFDPQVHHVAGDVGELLEGPSCQGAYRTPQGACEQLRETLHIQIWVFSCVTGPCKRHPVFIGQVPEARLQDDPERIPLLRTSKTVWHSRAYQAGEPRR